MSLSCVKVSKETLENAILIHLNRILSKDSHLIYIRTIALMDVQLYFE